MANIKSAEKRIRTSARRRARNRSVKSRLRGALKNQRASGKRETMAEAASVVDRAASKGAIHKKTAARYKSRLARAAKSASR